jgi:hypothetical protein
LSGGEASGVRVEGHVSANFHLTFLAANGLTNSATAPTSAAAFAILFIISPFVVIWGFPQTGRL